MPASLFPQVSWPGFDGLHVEIPIFIEAQVSADIWRKAIELGNRTWPYTTLKEVDQLPTSGSYIICREIAGGQFPTIAEVTASIGGTTSTGATLPCTAASAWGGLAFLFGQAGYWPISGKMYRSVLYVDPTAHWGDHLLHSCAHELWGHGVLALADNPQGEEAKSLMDYEDIHTMALDRLQEADMETAKGAWQVKKDRCYIWAVFPEGLSELVVWGHDAEKQAWLKWDAAAPLFANNLSILEPGMGLIVSSPTENWVHYKGKKTHLYSGLNLVGWPPVE